MTLNELKEKWGLGDKIQVWQAYVTAGWCKECGSKNTEPEWDHNKSIGFIRCLDCSAKNPL